MRRGGRDDAGGRTAAADGRPLGRLVTGLSPRRASCGRTARGSCVLARASDLASRQRTGGSTGATAMPHSASKHVTVEHIATEPMSGQQRKQAITALAALITAWQREQDEPDSATAPPLPGEASDTDHAA